MVFKLKIVDPKLKKRCDKKKAEGMQLAFDFFKSFIRSKNPLFVLDEEEEIIPFIAVKYPPSAVLPFAKNKGK